ncbi:hypothetical protein JCGZ_13487 [Jatropha curcas]|uniref:Fatty acyl-CoA reductase n=1 Tax=Jatropha curcas TaxID=180498 RepID=A0A067LC25_JATCU|nr:hypothetical protein JCGZ_13487 [Jatropha curcas]
MPPLSSSIGIIYFLKGNNYLVTGATGFLAKVLIEKMLRMVPDVGRIFLMIKGEDKDEVKRRLKNEVIDEELFRCLKEIHGKSYEAFMRSKLFPVLGNICKDNLGMDAYTAREIANQVHVIINIAANTTFDERYDVAPNTNTKGPSRLLDFANTCKNLKLFLHVSTAYINGERDGIVLEKPFHLGRSAEERMNSTTSSSQVSLPLLDVGAEMKLAFEMMKSLEYNNKRDQKMKDLGTQRAKMYGFYDTYSFTKAMGEMLINSKRESLTVPIVIVRPSIIESTYREPFPGWIQGNKVIDPLFISYGKGQLPGFVGNPNTILDIVPVDMVVNVILTAIAKHGSSVKTQAAELIYHITSSVSNPISLATFSTLPGIISLVFN